MKIFKCIIFHLIVVSSCCAAVRYQKPKRRIVRPKNNICATPGCVLAAANVIKNMDTTVKPCHNFYRFACGKYIKESIIPDGEDAVFSFGDMREDVLEKLRHLMEQPPKSNEAQPFSLLRRLFKTCMDKQQIQNNSVEILKKSLKDLGGWPVLQGNKFDKDRFDWKLLLYKLRKLGYVTDSLIKLSIEVDPKNSRRRVITLNQASLGLPKEVFDMGPNDESVKGYYNQMVNVAKVLGATSKRAAKDMKNSFEFEMKLAKISLPLKNLWNRTAQYNPSTIAKLQKKHPSIPWLEYINNILNIPGITVNKRERVVVKIPKYIKDLEKLLQSTQKRTLANYLMWRVVKFSIPYLSGEVVDVSSQLRMNQKGTSGKPHRGTKCIRDTFQDMKEQHMFLLIGSMYVRNFFDKSSRKPVRKMVSKLKFAFKRIVHKVAWMDHRTKTNAFKKLASMTTLIGYADEILDDTELKKYYSGLELNSDNYLTNILNVTRFNIDKSFGLLRQSVNKTDWRTRLSPALVNANYEPNANVIDITAAILQGAVFNHDRPQYMNYGGLGTIIGHEITHGFDLSGRLYDKDGNLVNWWTQKTNKAFLTKAQCIIDQYNNYSVPELKLRLNGEATANENIADNGGFIEAYTAYNRWTKYTYNGVEPFLPGLNYTPRQMFWISAANTFCANYRPRALKFQILTGEHSPFEFRMLGPLSNLKSFSKDFNCPWGSKMNPTNKCRVW